ncbi:MAG: hypothetical protein HQ510_08580 [Candidatus Marinimicrobia bacterium]|nr:hypothetical protein [Candidatus Neomarinimicrobiota bacterium]
MYRKCMITLALLSIWLVVSCDQNSPLQYQDQDVEVLSGSHPIQDGIDLSSGPRSGFNPKNGMTSGTDSTGFSVEP